MAGLNILLVFFAHLHAFAVLAYFLDPKRSPRGVYSTDITQSTAVIGWQEISRKDARGELLGYKVKVFNRDSWRYEQEVNTSDTSVILKDLSRATDYEVKIRGYTSVGSGPYIIAYFSTLACDAITIKNQLHGRIDFQYAKTLSITCIWKLVALTPNTLILFVLESLYLRSSWWSSRCRKLTYVQLRTMRANMSVRRRDDSSDTGDEVVTLVDSDSDSDCNDVDFKVCVGCSGR
ncbi:Down syndrome cell adhesion molecule-like protein 1-like [Exaiptasia diaphana]|nr:Down syndrome cell adhesion molecule-like protein 1-like [Exaiptasia diaphana]